MSDSQAKEISILAKAIDRSLEERAINTIRFLSVDAVQKANSGHPGLPMGAAAMAYVLWTDYLKHNPTNPQWANRDRFVLSAGHGSALLYSLLHLTGYDLSLDDLKAFRQLGSMTPGHPEYRHTPGVEVTTGPLGQGFANGVGMAIAEHFLAATFNRPGHEIIDHYTYARLRCTSWQFAIEALPSLPSRLATELSLQQINRPAEREFLTGIPARSKRVHTSPSTYDPMPSIGQ